MCEVHIEAGLRAVKKSASKPDRAITGAVDGESDCLQSQGKDQYKRGSVPRPAPLERISGPVRCGSVARAHCPTHPEKAPPSSSGPVCQLYQSADTCTLKMKRLERFKQGQNCHCIHRFAWMESSSHRCCLANMLAGKPDRLQAPERCTKTGFEARPNHTFVVSLML